MTRGTTVTHVFDVGADLREAEVLYVTYAQRGRAIIEKEKEDIEVTEDTLKVSLSQEDTLAFNSGVTVLIQFRARFPDGTAVASEILKCEAEAILKNGVI